MTFRLYAQAQPRSASGAEKVVPFKTAGHFRPLAATRQPKVGNGSAVPDRPSGCLGGANELRQNATVLRLRENEGDLQRSTHRATQRHHMFGGNLAKITLTASSIVEFFSSCDQVCS
jgi:hypothetical protein